MYFHLKTNWHLFLRISNIGNVWMTTCSLGLQCACMYRHIAMCLCYCTIADCGGLESILHSKVLPGITETVSWTSGMSSASSFSAPWGSSWRKNIFNVTVNRGFDQSRHSEWIWRPRNTTNPSSPNSSHGSVSFTSLFYYKQPRILYLYLIMPTEKENTKELWKKSVSQTSQKGFLTFFIFLSPFFSNFLWASYAWGSTLHKHSVHFP